MGCVNDGKMRESLRLISLYRLFLSFGNPVFSVTRSARIRKLSCDGMSNGPPVFEIKGLQNVSLRLLHRVDESEAIL